MHRNFYRVVTFEYRQLSPATILDSGHFTVSMVDNEFIVCKVSPLIIKENGLDYAGWIIFLSPRDEVISWSLKTDTISDTDPLFKPLQLEDCGICYLPLPFLVSGKQYKSCCGKVVCSGCMYAVARNGGKSCPFCRTFSALSREKKVDLLKKRVDVNDAASIYVQGCYHDNGEYGFPQDCAKALSLWHLAGKQHTPILAVPISKVNQVWKEM